MEVIGSAQEPKRETPTAPDQTRSKAIGGVTQTLQITFHARSGSATEANPCAKIYAKSTKLRKGVSGLPR